MDINNYISSGIIEMYVMGICSAEEKAELELLRNQYPQLNKAITQFEIEFENNALHNASPTGSKLDNSILQSLNELQTPVVNINSGRRRVNEITWLKPVAAAAIVLLAISSFFNYSLYKKTKAQQLTLNDNVNQSAAATLPQADYAILKNPSITPVAMYGVAPHSICRCTLFWDKKTGKAYMMIHHLVRTTQEKKYQLWAMVNDKPVNVGMVNDAIRDRFIELQNVPAGANAFYVTLEDAAGSPTPTMAEAYLYGKI
jgi:anti-sigma-K factor RskA